MVNLESLAKRARTSEDGEAYVRITKAAGYRLGAGARVIPGGEAEYFVEVVLDPFPHRPAVDPKDLAAQSVLAERLRRRGYSIASDDAGVITCERAMRRASVANEIREAPLLLEGAMRGKRKSRAPHRRTKLQERP